MELKRSLAKFKKRGLGVAAISYDSRAVLKHFSDRLAINYPLLSDPDSSIIRAFGILNTNIPEGTAWYGIPFPGMFIVDSQGKVLSKYFEQGHRQRYTADTIITKEYGSDGGVVIEKSTPHLKFRAFASQDRVRPGNRIMLILDVELPSKMHVYAPGAQGYKPVDFQIEEVPGLWVHETEFPQSRVLYLPVIKEEVAVYEDRVRITRDVTISPRFRGPNLEIPATFSYQACDDRVCYPPVKVPVTFHLEIESHDRQRAPESMRKKPRPRR